MELREIKSVLRSEMLRKRKLLSREEKFRYSDSLKKRLREWVDRNQPQVIHTFLPMGSEVDFSGLIPEWIHSGITVIAPEALPKGVLRNLHLTDMDKLEKGVMGTKYPSGEKVYCGSYDLIIVPGLAFDKMNFRLGYGGGYYDRFLLNHAEAKKVGVCYPFQLVDKVPVEPHDTELDEVIMA